MDEKIGEHGGILAKYDGVCGRCNETIYAGDEIVLDKTDNFYGLDKKFWVHILCFGKRGMYAERKILAE